VSGSGSHNALRDKTGGFAALYLGLAYIVTIPYFLLVSSYGKATTSAEKVAAIVSNHTGMYVAYLITYVFFGLVLAVLSLALFDRVRSGGEHGARIMAVVGLTWSVALILSGMVFNHGMGTVVSLAQSSPAQAAAAWQALESVSDALAVGTGETLGGLWMLLVCWTALRARALPKLLTWYGTGVGLVGVVSTVPGLNDLALVFGLLQIVWFAWLGVALLAPKARTSEAISSSQVLGGTA
jgi:hypothetical protein